MRNSIHFDETFTPELLINEESTAALRNSIWLVFETGPAENPVLEITVRTTAYTVELEPDTTYNYQLPGLYWAAGGTTSIRFVSGALVSDYVYLQFPEIISTDAALCEDSETIGNRYFMQGKDDPLGELKSETISQANSRDYYIGHLMTKIIEFIFGVRQASVSALLTFSITMTVSGVTDEADAIFHIRVNRVFDEVFIPTHTVKNRKYLMTFCYPVANLSQSDHNQIDIYLELTDGTAEIIEGSAIATLTASSIAAGSGFTGEIECLDITEESEIPEITTVTTATETLQISKQIPIGPDLSDTAEILMIPETAYTEQLTDAVRIINHGGAAVRVLEDETDIRYTEDGDLRMTEEEVS